MNFVHLVQLVIAWEEGEQRENLKVYAADAPVVHLVIVVAIGQQALRRPVPASADVFSEGWL